MIFDVLKSTLQFCLQIIAPPYCVYCKQFLAADTILCRRCDACIKPIVSHKIKLGYGYTMTVYAISSYIDPVRSLILTKGRSDIVVSNQLGKLLWQYTSIGYQEIDYFVPIPLHWARHMRRGFNQAHEIATSLGECAHVPVINLLKRIKRTKYQSSCSRAERVHNVKDAFVCTTDTMHYKNKHIFLIDDLMTT